MQPQQDDANHLDDVVQAARRRSGLLLDGPIRDWELWWDARWRELDDPAGRLARRQGFVLLTSQLPVIGCSRGTMRGLLRRGRWWTPARGVVSPVVPAGDDWAARRRRHAIAAAASALLRPETISARSAAILHGLPTMRIPELPQTTSAPAGATSGSLDATHVFNAALDGEELMSWFGLPVTDVARTVLDLARHDRWDGLMAADAALHEDRVTRAELRRGAARASGWPGVRRAREVIDLADARAESALESITRLRLHDDGFPAPRLQVPVHDPERRTTYRVDLVIEEWNLAIEADGRDKYHDDAIWAEKRREGRVRRLAGYRTERVLWSDVTTDWPETARRLRG